MPKVIKVITKSSPDNSSRHYFIDLAKVIAACSVILLHATIPVIFTEGSFGGAQWWVGNFLNSASRFAVPLFVMLSGAIFLGRPAEVEKSGSFLKKRVQRIAVPTVGWIIIYAIFHHYLRSDSLAPGFILKNIIFNEQYEHLYFLFLIAELWLLTPVLRPLLQQLSYKQQFGLAGLWLAVTIFWQPRLFILAIWVPYLFYYLAGGIITTRWKPQQVQWKLLGLWLLCVITTGLGTYALTAQGFTDNLYFYRYTSVTIIPATASLFLFFRSLEKNLAKLSATIKKILEKLAQLTLGVYVIAPMIMAVLSQWIFQFSHMQMASITHALFLTAVTIFLSFGVVYVMYQLPLIKKLVR